MELGAATAGGMMRFFWILMLLSLAAHAQMVTSLKQIPDYKPITGAQRVKWFVTSTVGPTSLLAAGPFSAAIRTAMDRPTEYGPHWEGFGKRYGMRLTGVATGNLMEAGLGAISGEDPRYFRKANGGFGGRVKYTIVTTFLAPGRDGHWRPAYARVAGNVGNNFLSNTWRADSESDAGDALLRCVLGVAGRMGSNAFQEFLPDLTQRIFHRK
jgi:hypothetical protein